MAGDRGIQLLVDDCNASAACLEASPDLAGDLDARRAALRDQPRPILVGGQRTVEDSHVLRLAPIHAHADVTATVEVELVPAARHV